MRRAIPLIGLLLLITGLLTGLAEGQNLTLIHRLEFSSRITSILWQDTTLVVATRDGWVQFQAIRSPLVTSFRSVAMLSDSVLGMTLHGNVLYAANASRGLQIFSVPDLAHPTLRTTVPTVDLATDVGLRDSLLILGNHYGGYQLFNLQDPLNPSWRSLNDLPGRVPRVLLLPNAAIIADYYVGVLAVNVDDPRDPRTTGTFAGSDQPEGLYAAGDYIYVPDADGILRTLHLESDGTLTEVSRWTGLTPFGTIAGAESLLAVDVVDQSVAAYDISRPDRPRRVGMYPLTHPGPLAVGDSIIAVAEDSSLLFLRYRWANSAPLARNPTWDQARDGTGLVTCSFELEDFDLDSLTLSVEVDYGPGWMPLGPAWSGLPSGRTLPGRIALTWNAPAELGEVESCNVRIRVAVSDGFAPANLLGGPWCVDTRPPRLAVASPLADATFNCETRLEVRSTFDDRWPGFDSPLVSLTSGAIMLGPWSVTDGSISLPAPTAGLWMLRMSATDAFGNESVVTVEGLSFDCDSAGPQVTWLFPPEGSRWGCPPDSLVIGVIDPTGWRTDSVRLTFNGLPQDPSLYPHSDRLVLRGRWRTDASLNQQVCVTGLRDTLGNPSTRVCMRYTRVIGAPRITGEIPRADSVLASARFTIRLTGSDLFDPLAEPILLTLEHGGETIPFPADSFFRRGDSLILRTPYTADPGDTFRACVMIAWRADFCPPPAESLCWRFSTGTSVPRFVLEGPADGEIIACAGQALRLSYSGPNPFDSTSLQWSVNDTLRPYPGAEWARFGDTLVYTPPDAWPDGESVRLRFVAAQDVEELPAICVGCDRSFRVVTSPPHSTLLEPTGDLLPTATPRLRWLVTLPAGTLDSTSLRLIWNGALLPAVPPAVTFLADTLSLETASLPPLTQDTLVTWSLGPLADLTVACGPNRQPNALTGQLRLDILPPRTELLFPTEGVSYALDVVLTRIVAWDRFGLNFETLTLSVNDTLTVSAPWTPTGDTITWAPSPTMFEGQYTLVWSGLRDSVGHLAESLRVNFRVDRTAPEVALLSPDPSIPLVGPPDSLIFTLRDPAGVDRSSVLLEVGGVTRDLSSPGLALVGETLRVDCLLAGLPVESESLRICLTAHDLAVGPVANGATTCFALGVLPGGPLVRWLTPSDAWNCPLEPVRFRVTSLQPLDSTTIRLVDAPETLSLGSRLYFSTETLLYIPTRPWPVEGREVTLLTISDILGRTSTPVTASMRSDQVPPTVTWTGIGDTTHWNLADPLTWLLSDVGAGLDTLSTLLNWDGGPLPYGTVLRWTPIDSLTRRADLDLSSLANRMIERVPYHLQWSGHDLDRPCGALPLGGDTTLTLTLPDDDTLGPVIVYTGDTIITYGDTTTLSWTFTDPSGIWGEVRVHLIPPIGEEFDLALYTLDGVTWQVQDLFPEWPGGWLRLGFSVSDADTDGGVQGDARFTTWIDSLRIFAPHLPPTARLVAPADPAVWSACTPLTLRWAIAVPEGAAPTGSAVWLGPREYALDQPPAVLTRDSLTLTIDDPPEGIWPLELLLRDRTGDSVRTADTLHLDTSAPEVSWLFPVDTTLISASWTGSAFATVRDTLSGWDTAQTQAWIDDALLPGASVRVTGEQVELQIAQALLPGSHELKLEVADRALCGPNLTTSTLRFHIQAPQAIPPGISGVHPNPFSPNGDGINETCLFEFEREVGVTLWDLANRPQRTLAGNPAIWDGADDAGLPVPEGPYRYVVTFPNGSVQEGMILLLRRR